MPVHLTRDELFTLALHRHEGAALRPRPGAATGDIRDGLFLRLRGLRSGILRQGFHFGIVPRLQRLDLAVSRSISSEIAARRSSISSLAGSRESNRPPRRDGRARWSGAATVPAGSAAPVKRQRRRYRSGSPPCRAIAAQAESGRKLHGSHDGLIANAHAVMLHEGLGHAAQHADCRFLIGLTHQHRLKTAVSAASFSKYFLYSLQVVAAMVRTSPRASAGFKMLAASPCRLRHRHQSDHAPHR